MASGHFALWENCLPGLKAATRAKGWPTHQIMDEFSPKRRDFWVETLFSDYRKAFPDRPVLTSHMVRKRAFTMAWQSGVDVRHAGIAYGCNVDALTRHYIALDEQQVTDAVFAKMHGVKPPEAEGLSESLRPNSRCQSAPLSRRRSM
jgi:hypothetical protein